MIMTVVRITRLTIVNKFVTDDDSRTPQASSTGIKNLKLSQCVCIVYLGLMIS